MKKVKYFVVASLIMSVINFSCKKDSNSGTTVEYTITPMSVYFTKITYADNSGNYVTITDPSKFSNGSASISISKKPFAAKLAIEFYNTTLQTMSFMLSILVNGQVMTTQNFQSPPGTGSLGSVQYTVQ